MKSLPAFWAPAPQEIRISPDQVHVWHVLLDQDEKILGLLRRFLSAEELDRASRFYFQRDQKRFITAHGFLRDVLARYLQAAPERIGFEQNSFGKPFLFGEFSRSGLYFNLSHSGKVGLLAVARNRQVGVDVERIRADFPQEDIARRFFSTREVSDLLSLSKEARIPAFFACWVRKEAYIKARGEGLSYPLDMFDVSVLPTEPAALLASRSDPTEPVRWTLFSLEVGFEHAAALAVEGNQVLLKCWDWDKPWMLAGKDLDSGMKGQSIR